MTAGEAYEVVDGSEGRTGPAPDLRPRDRSGAPPSSTVGSALPAEEMGRHIAYDIGARGVTLELARLLDAPAVLTRFSRLVIDPNRGEDDPTLLMRLYDGTIIPGNRDLPGSASGGSRPTTGPIIARSSAARAMAADGATPALVSIHSYTPQLRGRAPRPWQVGVLWHHDGRIARPLIARLRAEGLRVGDNEPYSGELEGDTMSRHGTGRGLPHVLIEIRQDLIGTPRTTTVVGRAPRPHLEPGDRGDSRWMTPPGPSSRPPRSARCATTCATAPTCRTST